MSGFGDVGMGESYQWDAVFPDGDIYKSGRTGHVLYISPETDTVVVWFSSTYQSTLWAHTYAREIVKTVYRKEYCKLLQMPIIASVKHMRIRSSYAEKDKNEN